MLRGGELGTWTDFAALANIAHNIAIHKLLGICFGMTMCGRESYRVHGSVRGIVRQEIRDLIWRRWRLQLQTFFVHIYLSPYSKWFITSCTLMFEDMPFISHRKPYRLKDKASMFVRLGPLNQQKISHFLTCPH